MAGGFICVVPTGLSLLAGPIDVSNPTASTVAMKTLARGMTERPTRVRADTQLQLTTHCEARQCGVEHVMRANSYWHPGLAYYFARTPRVLRLCVCARVTPLTANGMHGVAFIMQLPCRWAHDSPPSHLAIGRAGGLPVIMCSGVP